jgi:arginyl-tRNA synthetase
VTGLLALGWERYGSEEALAKDAIKHLFDVYVQINVRWWLRPRMHAWGIYRITNARTDLRQRDAGDDDTATRSVEIHDQARAYFKRMEDGVLCARLL